MGHENIGIPAFDKSLKADVSEKTELKVVETRTN